MRNLIKRRPLLPGGFSLLEMLFVIGCLGLIFLVVAGLMLSLNKALSDPAKLYCNYDAIYEFVPWVKSDVEDEYNVGLADGTAPPEGDLLVIRLREGGRVVYRETPSGLRRIRKPSGMEKNVLPPWLRADFFVKRGSGLGEDLVKVQVKDRRTGEVMFISAFATGG